MIHQTGEITLACDTENCDYRLTIPSARYPTGADSRTLRRRMRKAGWYISVKEGIMLCPECKERILK